MHGGGDHGGAGTAPGHGHERHDSSTAFAGPATELRDGPVVTDAPEATSVSAVPGADAAPAAAPTPALPRVPGLSHVDHVAFTVPDLEAAVRFFCQVFGAEELYRSSRGPDPQFMPEHFAVPADARLELAMLRMPPNLNVELFQWDTQDRRAEHPRHSDAGGHHLCFVVDDVDEAVAVLAEVPGVRVLGTRKEVGGDSPRVAGNRWIYLLTPWGLLMELVDRSRVLEPPALIGPPDWKGPIIPMEEDSR